MRHVIAALLFLLLCGCYSDQVEQAGKCELGATKFTMEHEKDKDDLFGMASDMGNLTRLCMQAHGYEFNSQSDVCKHNFPDSQDATVMSYIYSERETASICYTPIGWGERQINAADRWTRGISN